MVSFKVIKTHFGNRLKFTHDRFNREIHGTKKHFNPPYRIGSSDHFIG